MRDRCTATSKRTRRPCGRRAEPGWRVCRFHGAGGGRPIKHGRYSKALQIVGRAMRQQLLTELAYLDEMGEVPRLGADTKFVLALLAPPRRCEATAKQTGERCRRSPTPGWTVCHYHGARGGRASIAPGGFLGRHEGVLTRLRRQVGLARWRRFVALLNSEDLDPPATRTELSMVSTVRWMERTGDITQHDA